MDRKAILVLVTSFLLLLLWYPLVGRLYPPKPLPPRTNTTFTATTNAPGLSTNQPALSAAPNQSAAASIAPSIPKSIEANAPEQLLFFTNDNARYTFTSHGGGIKLIELLKYKQRVACRTKILTNEPATLNRVSTLPLPVLALLPNETLQGDGVFKLSPTANGVRAEKSLTNGLVLIKEFEPSSNYLVNASTRIENHSGQPILLPPQEWNTGTAAPMDETEVSQNLGFMWYDGSSKHA